MKYHTINWFKQNHPQLFHFWNTISSEQKEILINELISIDRQLLFEQQKLIGTCTQTAVKEWEACRDFAYCGSEEDRLCGEKLLYAGKLGCLLLAGGQGTRLQFNGPKGCYPISVIKKKSLFQLFAEKVHAASILAGRLLPIAIMTAPDNDQITRHFFETNHYFGLQQSQVHFFVQDTLPLLDDAGKLFLKNPYQIACGANGNGESLMQLVKSGIWGKWMCGGIQYIHTVLIDNPLADPYDLELAGFHHRKQVDITIKCIEKLQPEEKVGVIVKQHTKYRVVEYSEISESEQQSRDANGCLKHSCANLSLFCVSMLFIKKCYDDEYQLPLHNAWKESLHINKYNEQESTFAWKFETFIFDWLAYAEKVAILLYPRARCFAPLKNLKGIDSPSTVQNALQMADKHTFELLSDMASPDFPFELAASFYYPTNDMKVKWKKQVLKSSYTE